MKLKEFKAILLSSPQERFFIEHRGSFDKNKIWYGSLWPAAQGKKYESIHFTFLPDAYLPDAYLSTGGNCSIGCLGEIFDMKSLSLISKESYDDKVQSIIQLMDEGKFHISLRSGERLDITSRAGLGPMTQLTDADLQFIRNQMIVP